MRKYIIMGVQGCGKGTQAKLLQTDFDLVHISVGDIFRWHIQNHTKLAARIRRIVTAGGLVPDDIVAEVVKNRLEMHDWNYGFILDGFPRTVPQAQALATMLKTRGLSLDRVLALEVPRDLLIERAVDRRTDKRTGQIYHLKYNPPPPDADLEHRADDREEAVRKRLDVYEAMTSELLPYYEKLGILRRVNGVGSVEEVTGRVLEALGDK